MKAKDKKRLQEKFVKNIEDAEAGIVNMKYLRDKMHLLPNMWGIPGEYEANGLGDFTYSLPWDDTLFNKAVAKVKAAGWIVSLGEKQNLADKTKEIVFKHPEIIEGNEDVNLWFTVRASANRPGSTCKIQKIGENKVIEEVTKPIYEVVCPEADNPLAQAELKAVGS